jgi:hypothetical protein
MSRLPALTGKQLVAVLQQLGFESLRVKGSHHFLRHPDGRTEGEARGRQEGEAREAAKMTLRLLSRRCGPLSEPTTAQIQALPLEKLEALADALLDFQGPADLSAWLAAHT